MSLAGLYSYYKLKTNFKNLMLEVEYAAYYMLVIVCMSVRLPKVIKVK